MYRQKVKTLRHVGIVVSDINKSIYFYRDLLGLNILKDVNESGDFVDEILDLKGTRVRTIKLETKGIGGLIELLDFKSHSFKPKAKKIYSVGISHIAFTVDDIDRTYQKLVEGGIKFTTVPQYSVDKLAKVTFCYDPDGNMIELVEVVKKR